MSQSSTRHPTAQGTLVTLVNPNLVTPGITPIALDATSYSAHETLAGLEA